MSIYLLGTLDTKGREVAWLRDVLREYGLSPIVVDTGCVGEPLFAGDITREQVFQAAGTSLASLQQLGDRGEAVTRAAEGVTALAKQWQGRITGIISVGGSAGTTIATSAMRELPLGLPKVMVSTLASGQVRPYVGGKDIFMLNSVVDIAGINRISKAVMGVAARALAGMVTLHKSTAETNTDHERPLIAASMFGVTTPCVLKAQEILEAAGYEVLVFHATGNGGEAMEGVIADGLVAGVLDITTTELADELVGGILSAGPNRLTAAAAKGIPQVISVGATDMVNFGSTTPEKFADRKFYVHNPTVTLMRTTAEECSEIGREIAAKARNANGPVSILLPLHGVSAIDAPHQPFEDKAARNALFQSIRQHHGSAELIELPHHINEEAFAQTAAERLLQMLAE